MTSFSTSTIKTAVRKALDENVSDALTLNVNTDTLSVDELIDYNIPIAVRIVDTMAPVNMLGAGTAFTGGITWKGQPGYGMGYILLPTNFLRLVTFQMCDWERAVNEPITEHDPRYQVQQSRFWGISGNPQKPVVAIVNRPAGLTLEFYTCSIGAGAYIMQARYIPMPAVSSGNIDIPDLLYDAAVQYTAYLVALTLNQGDAAGRLLESAKQLMTM